MRLPRLRFRIREAFRVDRAVASVESQNRKSVIGQMQREVVTYSHLVHHHVQ